MPGELAITADDREPQDILLELQGRPEVRLTVARLTTGDFEVGERLLVERKTVGDFAASVVDGRLFRQAGRMASASRRGVLILEGGGPLPEGVKREAMQGALITVTVFFGIAVLRSQGVEESARLLVYLATQDQRYARRALPRSGHRPRDKRARQSFLLQGLPGVGPERAEALLTRFGSIEKILTASATDLATVSGVGETIALKIRWVLDDPAP